MGGCKCTFRGCTNTSANSPGTHFFHYPLKDRERCLKWVKYANTRNILDLPFSKARNKVVCETHFKDDCFMNYKKERLVHYAIPTIVRLNKDCCLDYEESDNPTPKPLLPPNKSHLIPPLEKKKELETDNEHFFGVIEDYGVATSVRSAPYEKIAHELSPPAKIKKFETPKILNSCLSQNIKHIDKNIIMQEDGSIEILDEGGNNVDIFESDNEQQETDDFINTMTNQSDCVEYFTSVDVRGEKYKISSAGEDAPFTATYKNIQRHRQVDNANSSKGNHIQGDFINDEMQAEKSQVITIEENTSCKITFQNSKNLNKATNSTLESLNNNYFNEFVVKEKKQLGESLLADINKDKVKLKDVQAQVEAISTSHQLVTSSTTPLTKVQLFNNIKKYLSPSMATLVRMEMFGGPDRDWRSDEKQVSVELLRLGDDVFKYLRDEWRFRLPPFKNVERWLNEFKGDADENL